MKTTHVLLLCGFLSWNMLFAQKAVIQGVILNEENQAVAAANIAAEENDGTQSNENGFYSLQVSAQKEISVVITYLGYKKITFNIFLKPGEVLEINPVLSAEYEQIEEIRITSSSRDRVSGITSLDPETIRKIPGANAGVENLLKTLPGVNSNNELSTQYAVRGGNYDENLVYVNGIEVYRPFLIRSGQQEGLSFINPDLVRNVHFSAGGFQAKYGDKLSSVLDVDYRRPVDFSGALEISLLGANVSIEGVSKNRKLTAIGGLRYRDNSLFVEAQQTETNFQPVFADAQANIIYNFSQQFEIAFLGLLSLNDYNYRPLTRQTNFGTLQDPKVLTVYYNGREEDQYRTSFGALKASWTPTKNYTGHLIISSHQTREQEYYDIVAQYRLETVTGTFTGENPEQVAFSEGIGAQLTHARNKLDALILNVDHSGSFSFEKHQLDYGLKYTLEDIRDKIREYEIIDSAGFSLRPPLPDFRKNEPYEPFTAPLQAFNSIRAYNSTQIQRLQAYVQWSRRFHAGDHELWFNAGLRSHTWSLDSGDAASSSQTVISPRAQIAFKPNWKKDMIFRLAGGVYQQPPFYREFRGPSGALNPQVEAQRSSHIVVGNDYSFQLFERPFKLTSEAYYKDLKNVNPYTLENVRIRYAAENIAEAYAYGLDLRLNGEFVPGTESWMSLGYLKTEENIENRGYISRPTDQRLKFGLVFQDYVPQVPDLKMYLNLIYNTGLPGGSPAYTDPYLYQTRLRDYHRADLGLFYLLKSEGTKTRISWFNEFQEVSVGLEIFNIFDRQNSITNTFVRDVYSKLQYAVPNYLSPRILNVKMGFRL